MFFHTSEFYCLLWQLGLNGPFFLDFIIFSHCYALLIPMNMVPKVLINFCRQNPQSWLATTWCHCLWKCVTEVQQVRTSSAEKPQFLYQRKWKGKLEIFLLKMWIFTAFSVLIAVLSNSHSVTLQNRHVHRLSMGIIQTGWVWLIEDLWRVFAE